MFNYYLLGQICVFLGIIFLIGYVIRYINDNVFGRKELRKYYERRKKESFWQHRT